MTRYVDATCGKRAAAGADGLPQRSRRVAHGRRAALCLSFAAAPTFAAMALVTAASPGAPMDVLCAATPQASPMSGMVAMYLLMGAFHLGPWLKLASRLASDVGRR